MTLAITLVTLLPTTATIQESTTTAIGDCTGYITGTAAVSIGITAHLTFNAGATAGARIHVVTSADAATGGTTYTTTGCQVYDVPVPAGGGAAKVSFSVLPGHRWYKVLVQNLDVAQDLTAVTVYGTQQVLS